MAFKAFCIPTIDIAPFFVFVKADKIEVRWILPLVIPFLVLLMSSFKFKDIDKKLKYGFRTFIVIIGVQFLRTPVEKLLGIPSSVHFGFEPISNILTHKYSNYQWMLPDVTYAGNIKLLNPDRTIFSSDDFSLNPKLRNQDKVLVFKGDFPNGANQPTDTILGFGMERDTLFFVKHRKQVKFSQ